MLTRAARPFRHGQYRILALALVVSLLGAGVAAGDLLDPRPGG